MKALFTSLFAGFLLLGNAQEIDMNLFKGMRMRHVGPATMSGRVTSIDAVADNPTTIYIGTASGGLWKSESGGITWEPIFDDQPVQSIGAVAVDQSNPDVVWAGTGEGNPRNSHSSGAGIFKSLDGGNTWKFMGLKQTRLIHRIVISKNNPDVVYVAALGSAWGPNSERGVFRTTDAGKSWEKILFVDDHTGCADLVVDPNNPNKLMAAMWEFGRKPYFFNSGGEGSGLYVSHDGGDHWVERTEDDGLPKGNLGRMGLAIAPSNSKICYALIESDKIALYKSTDGGVHWFESSSDDEVGNRPFYYADIYVNPHDEKEIWSLWSVVSRSDDGGKSFKTVIPYSGVHPDHHAFWISPHDPNLMIDGNDGGLNISRDGGDHWEYISNLPLGQFYHINYDMDIPYHIYGGMQDNGSWQGPAYKWKWGGGIKNHDWKEISFGDGFDVVSYPPDSRIAFSMWQGGNLTKTNIETGASVYIRPNHPDSVKLRFNWNAAIAQDPFSDCGLYFGSQFLHYTNDCGSSWNLLSPDLTTNDTLKQKQAESGGLTFDVTDAENYTTILCIAPSALEKDVVWVGTDDGNVQLTRNGGKTWMNVAENIKGFPAFGWVVQIELSSHHKGEAFVVVNNYRQNDWSPYLFHTVDYGEKWERLIDTDAVSGHVLSVVQDPVQENLLFLGTENGLYVSFDKGEVWNHWDLDFPTVSTMDLKIHPREGDLIIGTFGRAAYVLDDISPLREVTKSGVDGLGSLQILGTPDAYLAEYGRSSGVRFPADMDWNGENRWSGARISYFVKFPESDDDEESDKSSEEEIQVYILNQDGDSLRHFSTTVDTSGVHVLHWGLDTKDVQWPRRGDRKKDAEERGGGMRVPPGEYKIVLEWSDNRDSSLVQILEDPRVPFNWDAYEKKKELRARWQEVVSLADQGFERTKKGMKTLDLVKGQLVHVPDSLTKELFEQADSLRGELTAIQNRYMLPEGTKGYRDESELLSSMLWGVRSYLDTGEEIPGENALLAIEKLERKTQEIIAEINELFDGAWKEWREEVEKLDYSLFEDFSPLE